MRLPRRVAASLLGVPLPRFIWHPDAKADLDSIDRRTKAVLAAHLTGIVDRASVSPWVQETTVEIDGSEFVVLFAAREDRRVFGLVATYLPQTLSSTDESWSSMYELATKRLGDVSDW